MKIQSNKVKRNEPCLCGSGLKTKHCCLTKILEARRKIDDGQSIEQIIVGQILGAQLFGTEPTEEKTYLND